MKFAETAPRPRPRRWWAAPQVLISTGLLAGTIGAIAWMVLR